MRSKQALQLKIQNEFSDIFLIKFASFEIINIRDSRNQICYAASGLVFETIHTVQSGMFEHT